MPTMSTSFRLLVSLALLATLSSAIPSRAEAPLRVRERFDSGWHFRRDAAPARPRAGGDFRWLWRRAEARSLDEPRPPADLEAGNWMPAGVGEDVFHGRTGFAWFWTDLGSGAAGRDEAVHFESVDDNVVVFLNGV